MIKAQWIDNTNDNESQILCVTEGGETIATGRISVKNGDFFMEDIFVAENRRGMGYGDFAARLMIRKCYEQGGRIQRLTAPEEIVGFFGKLGFFPVGEFYKTKKGIFADMIREGDISGEC